jgi:hypothetical protein
LGRSGTSFAAAPIDPHAAPADRAASAIAASILILRNIDFIAYSFDSGATPQT